MNLSTIVGEAYSTATQKGFWDKAPSRKMMICTKLLLIHSEITEAMEAIREGDGDGNLGEELADAVIRIADLAGFAQIDLDFEVKQKMAINKARPYKHHRQF